MIAKDCPGSKNMRESPVPNPGVATTSLRIIAAATVFAACYVASSVVITLVCSIFIAFVLDPVVQLTERLRCPRWLGSIMIVLLALALLSLVGFLVYGRLVEFTADLPILGARIQEIMVKILQPLESLELSGDEIFPRNRALVPTVRVETESGWEQYIFRGIGSIYTATVTVMFIPFLVFFMLTSKHQLWKVAVNLFKPEQQQVAEGVIHGISHMTREYILGNIIVALFSSVALLPVFYVVGVRYALLMAPLCAFLNLIPYIGVALALLPPLLLLLIDPTMTTATPFVIVTVAVVLIHFLAVSLLTPKLVGHRVKLNALAVTVALMFWGWLWGAPGLIIAVPLTAAIKAVCDNVQGLKPFGSVLGEG